MIEKRTVIDQIEVTRDGTVQIRFALLLVKDGTEIDCKWHRTAIELGGDVDAQLAVVNEHLAAMGKAPTVSAEPSEPTGEPVDDEDDTDDDMEISEAA